MPWVHAAILLPWVGGELPPHLSFTCHSMIGGARRATLLLFHEAAQRSSVPEACRIVGNVEVEELGDGGLAALHGRRLGLLSGSEPRGLTSRLARLFHASPSSLSEFKPAWGWVFGEYLEDYTHWTYTDADVVFGGLDDWRALPGPP